MITYKHLEIIHIFVYIYIYVHIYIYDYIVFMDIHGVYKPTELSFEGTDPCHFFSHLYGAVRPLDRWTSCRQVKLNSRFEFPRKLDLSPFAPDAGARLGRNFF